MIFWKLERNKLVVKGPVARVVVNMTSEEDINIVFLEQRFKPLLQFEAGLVRLKENVRKEKEMREERKDNHRSIFLGVNFVNRAVASNKDPRDLD